MVVYKDGGFARCSQTDRQTGTDRQAGGGVRLVVEGTRVKGKDKEEMKRKRERKCALSCLNENKQLSDSLRTLKKKKKNT